MPKHLIIVESPSKCHKVEKAAGKDYKCLSSCGHIYQLTKGLQAIDIENGYEPTYMVSPDKKKVVSGLKKALKGYDTIYLASDPDREGEAIAYHLAKELGILRKAKRITFNSITPTAIQKALQEPRKIDMNMYHSQTARRVLDRLMGFEISPLLWSHLPNETGLSAGRCQSPALALVYEREQEIKNFKPKSYYDMKGQVNHCKMKIPIVIKYPQRIESEETTLDILKHCLQASFSIQKIEKRTSNHKPPPPFTTSTLQQEASSKIGMSPKETMMVAQKLYEGGWITYMRTDSITISNEAKDELKGYILDTYGKSYYQSRDYTNQVKNAQEAHECIRCLDPRQGGKELMGKEERLYQLILKRTLACQMSNQVVNHQDIEVVSINKEKKEVFQAHEEEVVFDGYTILYSKTTSKIHTFHKGDDLELNQLEASPELEKAKPRYTEASLVKQLEKSGIGRPSTFSNIITTLKDRKYVEKGLDTGKKTMKKVLVLDMKCHSIKTKMIASKMSSIKDKLVATLLGERVFLYLREHFTQLLNDQYTCLIESQLDKIANGEMKWSKVVDGFYQGFHPQVVSLTQRQPTSTKKVNKEENIIKIIGVNGEGEYGIRKTKFGPCFYYQYGESIKFLTIVKELYGRGVSVSRKKLEFLFSLPRDCGDGITLCYGTYGFYLKKEDRSVRLDDDYDSVPELTQLHSILAKSSGSLSTKKVNKKIKELNDYIVMEGQYGPYIIYKNKFYKIPKSVDLTKITLSGCKKIVSGSKQKK